MSKLATIQKLHSIRHHKDPEVNRIECGKVHEWPVVLPKGLHRDGELVVFIEIDSIVPATETFKFMERQKYRVWNARFRGEPSSGLVLPLSVLETCGKLIIEGNDIFLDVMENLSVNNSENYEIHSNDSQSNNL